MLNVLIVDDIAENLYFLDVLLRGNGFGVLAAANGAEALESARKSPPDLIISDILMPVMDGYALCREWRADERLRQIPFIFYTATFIEKKDEELALGLGADRFVIKPQEPDDLMVIIREVLAGNRSGAESRTEAAHPEEGELLREYNEALFRKLEKKMFDLEQANRELEQKMLDQRHLEEQLRQVQKMEAIGRFSTGIAHDFNNILTVIFGFGSVMKLKMAAKDPMHENIDHILAAADRAANLTRSLLTFSRKQEMKLQLLSLNSCIRNVEKFLRRIIGEDIKLITSQRVEEILIYADGGHVEQVLMNLAANARDAMPDGGILSIGTDIVVVDDEFIRMHGYGKPGRYALLTFADNGTGMNENTRQRIFEPFFTTKETDKGTGLGLSIIYGIVEQHNGHISVYSEPGQGTTFKILLPLMSGEFAADGAGIGQLPLEHGDETILVVDDEAPIRQYLESFLTTLGYKVLLAQDGREAVQLFRDKGAEVDLVLMDVIMPYKNGREAAREIKELQKDIKIVFTSGYPHDLIHERNLLDDDAQILMKPLTPTDLARKLRAAFDGCQS
ncbi:blue-light-activated protein [Geobacter sp. OR-1]|uniref:response regulator n=1 Tax=Geobacter sp. OR-1 TaxID=1266765 RepID=UPI0005421D69|nr:response regulator [Geobacter sp. OR-1]GAM10226.1 blue-light-activated protein [Geobacter sp. OR-1]